MWHYRHCATAAVLKVVFVELRILQSVSCRRKLYFIADCFVMLSGIGFFIILFCIVSLDLKYNLDFFFTWRRISMKLIPSEIYLYIIFIYYIYIELSLIKHVSIISFNYFHCIEESGRRRSYTHKPLYLQDQSTVSQCSIYIYIYVHMCVSYLKKLTIGNLISDLPFHIKCLIRQLKRLYRKIINNNYSQVWNKTCMK